MKIKSDAGALMPSSDPWKFLATKSLTPKQCCSSLYPKHRRSRWAASFRVHSRDEREELESARGVARGAAGASCLECVLLEILGGYDGRFDLLNGRGNGRRGLYCKFLVRGGSQSEEGEGTADDGVGDFVIHCSGVWGNMDEIGEVGFLVELWY